MKVNHEANFMKALVECKLRLNSTVTLFEWDVENNRYESNVTESAWNGYRLAVLLLTGEIL